MRNRGGRFSAGIPTERAATDSISCAAATKQPNVWFGGSQGSAAQAMGSSSHSTSAITTSIRRPARSRRQRRTVSAKRWLNIGGTAAPDPARLTGLVDSIPVSSASRSCVRLRCSRWTRTRAPTARRASRIHCG